MNTINSKAVYEIKKAFGVLTRKTDYGYDGSQEKREEKREARKALDNHVFLIPKELRADYQSMIDNSKFTYDLVEKFLEHFDQIINVV